MKDLLVQPSLSKVLLGRLNKSNTITNDDWANMEERACNTIQLSLLDEALQYVVEIKSAPEVWLKLKSIYITTSSITMLIPPFNVAR